MLPTKLYLDTARLGQTSPSALQAQIDFARLTAEDPSSLYFEEFLRDGVDACPEIADQFPGLAHWHGIADLKRRLASMAGDPDQLRVLLANRSAELMRLAARCQFQVCRNVLVTDLSWPNRLAILKEEAARAGGRVTMAQISRSIMRDRCSSDDVCHHLSRVYATQECDGLFLPIVSNLGVHLPVAKIVAALRSVGPVVYTIADGAQALNHVDLTEPMKASDFIVAGTHKWLRSGQQMGIGLIPCPMAADSIDGNWGDHVLRFSLSDPLFRLIEYVEAKGLPDALETVNLNPVFACHGALLGHCSDTWECRLNHFRRFISLMIQLCRDSGWKPALSSGGFSSGILVLRVRDTQLTETDPNAVRTQLSKFGISASTYPAGIIRLSAPVSRLNAEQLCIIHKALICLSPSFQNTPRVSETLLKTYSGQVLP